MRVNYKNEAYGALLLSATLSAEISFFQSNIFYYDLRETIKHTFVCNPYLSFYVFLKVVLL
jgi:hypothetical protein